MISKAKPKNNGPHPDAVGLAQISLGGMGSHGLMRGLGVTRGAHPPGPKRSVGLAAGMRIELRAPKGFPVGYYGGWTGHELYVRPVLFYFIPFPLNHFPCVILFCASPPDSQGGAWEQTVGNEGYQVVGSPVAPSWVPLERN